MTTLYDEKYVKKNTTFHHMFTGQVVDNIEVDEMEVVSVICSSTSLLSEWKRAHEGSTSDSFIKHHVNFSFERQRYKDPVEIKSYKIGQSRDELFRDSEEDMKKEKINLIVKSTTFYIIGQGTIEEADEKEYLKIASSIVSKCTLSSRWEWMHEDAEGYVARVHCVTSPPYSRVLMARCREKLLGSDDKEFIEKWKKFYR